MARYAGERLVRPWQGSKLLSESSCASSEDSNADCELSPRRFLLLSSLVPAWSENL